MCLFCTLSNAYFVVTALLLIYVVVMNVMIIFVVMFMSEYCNDSYLWTVGDGSFYWFVQVFFFIKLFLFQTHHGTELFGLQDQTRL